MHLLLTSYPNKWRDLKRFIDWLIKWGLVGCVQKINYVKSYSIQDGAVKKEEEKILLIKTSEENKQKIEAYFEKNHPSKIYEMTWISPHEVNNIYNTWINEPRKIGAKKNQ